MDTRYEITEECYKLLLEDYYNGSKLYYELFGRDGISSNNNHMM